MAAPGLDRVFSGPKFASVKIIRGGNSSGQRWRWWKLNVNILQTHEIKEDCKAGQGVTLYAHLI